MGRLIKNHWARLIILSAAGCKFAIPTAAVISWWMTELTMINRASRRFRRRLLLAQDILGFPNKKSQRRRQTDPRPPNHQPHPGFSGSGVGMAVEAVGGLTSAPQHRPPSADLPAQRAGVRVDVSIGRCGDLLSHRHGGVFLGL
jgi:hypothetical protein